MSARHCAFRGVAASAAGLAVAFAAMSALPPRATAMDVEALLPIKVKTTLTAGRRYTFVFGLYDAPTGGTKLWEESKIYRLPSSKVVSHNLGSVVPLSTGYGGGPPVDFTSIVYAEVKAGSFVKRLRLAAGPYALRSEMAVRLDRQLGPAAFAPSGVTGAALAEGAVTSTEIADGAVGTSQLADGAVTAAKLGYGAVGTTALGTGAVTEAKIANGTVDYLDMPADSIGFREFALAPEKFHIESYSADAQTVTAGTSYRLCYLSRVIDFEGGANATWKWCDLTYVTGTGWVLSARGGSWAMACEMVCLR